MGICRACRHLRKCVNHVSSHYSAFWKHPPVRVLLISGTFTYHAGILASSDDVDSKSTEKGHALAGIVGPSVCWCVDTQNKYSGTAFAVTDHDFISNRHVVERVGVGGAVSLSHEGWKQPVTGVVKAIGEGEENDLAWIHVTVGPSDGTPWTLAQVKSRHRCWGPRCLAHIAETRHSFFANVA